MLVGIHHRATGIPNKAIILILALLLAGLACLPAVSAESTCRTCHLETGGDLAEPVKAMDQNDVHASRGFSCDACHGGDPTASDAEAAMNPKKGFIGVPSPRQIPEVCGRCHSNPEFMRKYSVSIPTDQYEKYWTSRHGMALKAGDTKVATCASCHSFHTVLPANNPKSSVWHATVPQTCRKCHGDQALMSQYHLPADIYDQYAQSVHGKALLTEGDVGAPACNNCHGNHGATPPGFESVAQVCRNCHPANSEAFLASPHKPAFDATGLKECVACHSNHLILPPSDDWVGVQGDHSCGQCHSEGDAGYQTALAIHSSIDSLRFGETNADSLVREAQKRGIEISEAEDLLKQAHDSLLKVRTIMHTVDRQKVGVAVDSGLAAANQAALLGRKGIADFHFRGAGLGVASVLITLLIIALWLKLRQIERK